METAIGIGVLVGLAALGAFMRGSIGRSGNDEVTIAFRVSDRVPISGVMPNMLVRVAGSVKATGPLLRAPLSGTECVYYAVLVEEEVAIDARGRDRRWQVKYVDCDHVAFGLDDGTGVAMVDPLGAETLLREQIAQTIGFLHSPSPEQLKLMAKYNDSGSVRRFRESVIVAGEQLAIAGSATPAGEPHRASGATYAFAANDVFKLAITNRPRLVRKR